ncbi:glycoside hydrolase family 36 protein [Herbiconiux liukaitaii]|uniref:glycoside hydrolase family 36 protein n=1 Tax=Herbiconiux liukaitaii TaxID=3342799 RepID=UPI0035BA6BC8
MNSIQANEAIEAAERFGLSLHIAEDQPASLAGFFGCTGFGRQGVGMVEVFTLQEQRARTSQAYVRSAVGERLRFKGYDLTVAGESKTLTVTQRDDDSGLVVRTHLTRFGSVPAITVKNTVTNESLVPVTLTLISSLLVGIGSSESDLAETAIALGESEWLAEGRWRERPLRDLVPYLNLGFHGQDGRGRFARTSHGAWSTGEHVPAGVLTRHDDRTAMAWQIETSGAWHQEVSQGARGAVLGLFGPTDAEHCFAHKLAPGASFESVPATVAVVAGGRDAAIGALTQYRRAIRLGRPADAALPVIYNDFMNTLMGEPTTEKLLPLIDGAARAGAEYFCIDAGWFADPTIGDWWSTIGEWREATSRFSNGLDQVLDAIHTAGMNSGLWLEPEIVGALSPAATELPEEAFFQRHGVRVREHDRFHLDLRHPAAREHLDRTVDHLVETYGVSYFKLDYNINPGVGTDLSALDPGDGLLGHTRAFRDWLIAVQDRHPEVLFENCSSGAMRMDSSLVSVSHLQSTSDQQDYRLYPPIAASAPVSMPPEQCGNWAYPVAGWSQEETGFSLVAGIMGRLYLSGFLNELDATQFGLVKTAVNVHRSLRDDIAAALPFYPTGLPGWDDDILSLGLQLSDGSALVAIWSRGDSGASQHLDLPLSLSAHAAVAEQVFPPVASHPEWAVTSTEGEPVVDVPAGIAARILRFRVG